MTDLGNQTTRELAEYLFDHLEKSDSRQEKIEKMVSYLSYVYQKGLQDGFNESSDHTKALQQHVEKYR